MYLLWAIWSPRGYFSSNFLRIVLRCYDTALSAHRQSGCHPDENIACHCSLLDVPTRT